MAFPDRQYQIQRIQRLVGNLAIKRKNKIIEAIKNNGRSLANRRNKKTRKNKWTIKARNWKIKKSNAGLEIERWRQE